MTAAKLKKGILAVLKYFTLILVLYPVSNNTLQY